MIITATKNTKPVNICIHLFIVESRVFYLKRFIFLGISFVSFYQHIFKLSENILFMDKIEHIKIKEGIKVSDLVSGMKGMGFGARNISDASQIIKTMFSDKECKVFLGVAGAMVPAGMKKIIIDLIGNTDVFVTTGANLTHDLIEALGHNHYKGDEKQDDAELKKKGMDRIYNVLMPNNVYEKLEDFFSDNFGEFKECGKIKDFLLKIGEVLSKNDFGKDSILRKCYESEIEIFCPGIADSGIGLMMWGRIVSGKGETSIDVFSDMNDIIDIAWTSEKNGIIYIGGGLPKNFIQQSLQFSKGADYGVQITTDSESGGGSSGASLREGISWGKMNDEAKFIDVRCDATIALPLIMGYLKDNL